MALNFVLMTFGAFYFYPRLIGTFLNCCFSCCHFAAWITALAVRFSPIGNMCGLNISGNQYEVLPDGTIKFNDSWTYKKDGSVLALLGFLQMILWCC